MDFDGCDETDFLKYTVIDSEELKFSLTLINKHQESNTLLNYRSTNNIKIYVLDEERVNLSLNKFN